MPTDCIAFRDTNYFSALICDYLDEKQDLKSFYNRFPNIENFRDQIEEKKKSFDLETRQVLVNALKDQYKSIEISELTQANIKALLEINTFTITTGHQLNLFTGPLYFLYKIISTINLTKELKQKYPDSNFVPIYWMATEDHDFEEINYFNFQGQKVKWEKDSGGAVGAFNLRGIEEVFKVFSNKLGGSENAEQLKSLFKKAYLETNNLAEATRVLANELFKEFGLVIIDANTSELKKLFIPFIQKEIEEEVSFKHVTDTNAKLSAICKDYKIQVNPRNINLFYLRGNLRERIVHVDGIFSVYGTDISWSKEDLLKEVFEHPERFSPNVIMRPLYQEVILPNLCYIGGGGELAYWFQLKSYFDALNVPFPILLLRNSVLIKTEKQSHKLEKLKVSNTELFINQEHLISKKVKELSKISVDFTPQKEHLKKQFEDLYALAEQTDKSFLGAVKAQERKQIKGLEHLEKRLLKAQKRKLKDHTDRIVELQNDLFPNQSLQERQLNFSELFLEHGESIISILAKELKPLKGEFLVLTI